tara:strand:- start:343 stop:1122 length:780 start_codon:yes stop_codon:yes gene_type:complete
MEVYILSAGRPNTQPTWEALPQSIRNFTRVVIQQVERDLYADFIKEFPDNYLILPVEINRISPTRQYLLDRCQSEKLIMLDDDLTFSYRATTNSVKLTPQTPQEVERMFSDIDYALDNYAHIAVSTREGNNRVEQSTKEVGRALRFHAMVAPIVREKARFDRIEFKQDFDYTLQMLRAGHPNLIFYNYAHNQPGSNKPGGCSTYRSHEVLERCAHELHALHPDFVTVVEKETKGAWGGGVRTDVRIKWKQAYESSLKND